MAIVIYRNQLNIVITFKRDITKHKRIKRHQGLNSPTRTIDIAKTEQNRCNLPLHTSGKCVYPTVRRTCQHLPA